MKYTSKRQYDALLVTLDNRKEMDEFLKELGAEYEITSTQFRGDVVEYQIRFTGGFIGTAYNNELVVFNDDYIVVGDDLEANAVPGCVFHMFYAPVPSTKE